MKAYTDIQSPLPDKRGHMVDTLMLNKYIITYISQYKEPFATVSAIDYYLEAGYFSFYTQTPSSPREVVYSVNECCVLSIEREGSVEHAKPFLGVDLSCEVMDV